MTRPMSQHRRLACKNVVAVTPTAKACERTVTDFTILIISGACLSGDVALAFRQNIRRRPCHPCHPADVLGNGATQAQLMKDLQR